MKINSINKTNFLFYIFILLPILLIIPTIGTNAGNFFEGNSSIRELTPHFLLLVFLFFNIKNKFYNILNYKFFTLFFAIFFGQLIGLMVGNYLNLRNDFYGGLNFLISIFFFFNYLFYLQKISEKKNNLEILKLLFITVFFAFSIYAITILILSYEQFLFYPSRYGYGGYELNYFDYKLVFNSNGISRIWLFIVIFYLCFFFSDTIKVNRFNLLINFFIFFVIFFIIYYYQSRYAIYSLILIILILIYKFKNFSKSFLIILCLFFSFFFAEKMNKFLLKNYSNQSKFFSFITDKKIISEETIKNYLGKLNNKQNRVFSKKYYEQSIKTNWDQFEGETLLFAYSSGRIGEIKFAIEYLLKNKIILFFGGGPEFDRYIYKPQKYKTVSDIANGALYALLTGGILSFIGYLLLGVIFFKSFIKLFFIKNNTNDYFITSSLLITFVIFLRTGIEKSYIIWGFDTIFMYISFLLFLNYKDKVIEKI